MRFPTKTSKQELAVLSDFDGVISVNNVLEALYDQFSPVNWRTYADLWRQEKISSTEEIPLSLGNATATREEMEAFLESLAVDSSFTRLAAYCQKKELYLAVVSDGLRWYIEILLGKLGLEDIPTFANEVQFTDQGLTFSFPWFDESTPLTGISKAKIVQRIQQLGYRVLFIGDGLSDKEAAKVADIVFAKDYLLSVMLNENRAVREFFGFGDLLNKMDSIIDETK